MTLLTTTFEVVARRRPVDIVRPGELPPAPYLAVTGEGPLTLAGPGVEITARYDGHASLTVDTGDRRPTRVRSRRHGRAKARVDALGLALTGTQATVLTREADRWVARGRVDLEGRVDTRDEAWLAGVEAGGGTAGAFGQLGLRDLRLVTRADGSPYRLGRVLLLTATSAGPGFFATAHTSVWSLDPDTLELAHRADLFFRRPDKPGVYGDHATHLVRDDEAGRWLVATSGWGDFDKRRPVQVLLASSTADLSTGAHVLDTTVLALPTDGLTSVAVWDPHLVRTGDGWLVGYVSASRYFRFHPVLAGGPSLDDLRLLGADPARRSCEGTTLHRDPASGTWQVLASDRGSGEYPVYDLALSPIGRLSAPYPSNIPWPTVVPVDGGWLMVAFDGQGYGGRLTGYGTHGDVVVMRSTPAGG